MLDLLKYKMTIDKEGKIGECRKFNNDNNIYEIKEILENPNLSIYWTWSSTICPHCKQRINREIKHDFYRIEILANVSKNEDEITINDIYISGNTLDRRKMMIPKDHFVQILLKSNKFKHLAKEV